MTIAHSAAPELAQLLEGTTAGALIPEIVRRGFHDLLEAEVSAAIGAARHERSDERATYRNGYRNRVLCTQVGDLTLAIPKLRSGSFFPSWLEPRRRVDKALHAVVARHRGHPSALIPCLDGVLMIGTRRQSGWPLPFAERGWLQRDAERTSRRTPQSTGSV